VICKPPTIKWTFNDDSFPKQACKDRVFQEVSSTKQLQNLRKTQANGQSENSRNACIHMGKWAILFPIDHSNHAG
jgi:hypothetical protein